MNLIYPTMVTPFKDTGEVDYTSLGNFIDFLTGEGTDGLFAVCQSSEMFNLTLDEKVEIALFVRENFKGEVVASGHTQKEVGEQVDAMKKVAASGVDGIVLISNAFADSDEDDEVFIRNMDRFLNAFQEEVPLGIYECPYPYKRLLSEKELSYLLGTKRFRFFKDTSCDVDMMQRRLELMKDSDMMLFNANVETVAKTASMGAAGFSGVLGNVTIKAVRYVMDNSGSEITTELQAAIDALSEYMRNSIYPVCAKALLKDMHIFESIHTRVKDHNGFSDKMLYEGRNHLKAVRRLENEYIES